MNNTTREKIERKSINIISKMIDELPQVLTNIELLNKENNNLANLLCDYNKLKIDYNNLEKKYNNQLKRIERFEEIYNVVPGTTKEDKDRFLKFLAVNVLPSIISEAQSSTYKMVERHWNKYHTSKLKKVLSKYVTVENYTITTAILTFFILLKDEDLFFDDLTGIITRICNNTQEVYYSFDKLQLENVFKNNNKLSSELTREVIDIYNYYRQIYNNNSEKVKYSELVNILLEEYNDVMYEALMKCD